jgi:hypothetical protein
VRVISQTGRLSLTPRASLRLNPRGDVLDGNRMFERSDTSKHVEEPCFNLPPSAVSLRFRALQLPQPDRRF